jgi:hypothetical protein
MLSHRDVVISAWRKRSSNDTVAAAEADLPVRLPAMVSWCAQ